MKLAQLKIAATLLVMLSCLIANAQSIVSERTFTGCSDDDEFILTNGPYTSITWSLSNTTAYLSGKLPYQPITSTTSDHIAFNWNLAIVKEANTVVLRADFTKGTTTGF